MRLVTFVRGAGTHLCLQFSVGIKQHDVNTARVDATIRTSDGKRETASGQADHIEFGLLAVELVIPRHNWNLIRLFQCMVGYQRKLDDRPSGIAFFDKGKRKPTATQGREL